PKSKAHGSYHWLLERGLSLALLPTIGYAFVGGPNAINDLLLGILIPVHSHIGLDALLKDYLHPRNYPVIGKIAQYTLLVCSAGTLYGLYTFNTHDVGITAFMQRVW
ncbi:hypothetical protein CXG81DRAFT_6715, partial [Caulochytrium protostelioides]